MTKPALSDAARELLRLGLMDDELRVLRQRYCGVVSEQLQSVSSWLVVDSWLGGGKMTRPGRGENPTDPAHAEFRGAATVVEMAAELTRGNVLLFEQEAYYAGSAMMRQLIETEYLISWFADDLSHAKDWYDARPEKIRTLFTPKKMRAATKGRFSDQEYWKHCEQGGHPAPQARGLLRFSGWVPVGEFDIRAALWCDLAHHLRRIWNETCSLLNQHHARFVTVRRMQIDAVAAAEKLWATADPLAYAVDYAEVNAIPLVWHRRRGSPDAEPGPSHARQSLSV